MVILAAVAVGCGSSADGMRSTSSGQRADGGVVADAGAPAIDAGTADAGTPDTCPLSPHWTRDWALPVGNDATLLFHSPQPGDLWLESFDDIRNYAQLYHRVAGTWAQVFGAFVHATTSMWVRSPTEAWILEGNNVHVVGANPQTLQLPNDRYYSAIGDGWISYFQPGQTLPAGCNPFTTNPGVVGFFRVTDSGLVDFPMPELCSVSLPVDIYMGTAVTPYGGPLSWNGSTWDWMPSHFGGGGHNSYGVISGTASYDLYIVGAMQTQHFDGTGWKPFGFHTIDVNDSGLPRSVWAAAWGGPRWGTSTTNVFEFSAGDWQDRGRLPVLGCGSAGWAAIGSDGTDVFVTGEVVQKPPVNPPYSIWIYRYSP
jgi:hypothetical protein